MLKMVENFWAVGRPEPRWGNSTLLGELTALP